MMVVGWVESSETDKSGEGWKVGRLEEPGKMEGRAEFSNGV